ncbi:hypothetical protein DFH28DRAFT_1224266 [Melampsora americana]|nr:hypothetical protein DFH28DRAFT_1224266 [Melampsora americana]
MKILAALRSSKASYGLDEQEHQIGTRIEGDEHTSKDVVDGSNIYESEGIIRSFTRVTSSLLVKTLAPFFNFFFFPMPTKKVPNYLLKALNPYRLVPYPKPPVSDGKDTGLICQSKACRTRPSHSTVYFRSKHRHLTGIKCPFDKDFIRTYNSENFIQQIKELNNRRDLNLGVPSLENSDREAAMELHRMLNGPITPPPTQQSTSRDQAVNPTERERNSAECFGINGQYAGGHQVRKNAECIAHACKACCLKLNFERPCQTHSKMARRKNKEDRERGRVPITPQQTNQRTPNVINLLSSSVADSNGSDLSVVPPSTQCGRSHGVRMYKGRLQTDFLDEYRTMTLKREAAERKSATNADVASRTIALVIWPGSKDEPLGSWGGMVHASTWPQFALSESKDVKDLVAQELGGGWSGNLQVWNEENQLWIHTAIDIIVTYPENTRKLLVVFPGIKPTQCHDVERHLASVSNGGKKDSMNLTAFIQRNNSVTPQRLKNSKVKVNIIDLQSGSSTPERVITPAHSSGNSNRDEPMDCDNDLPPLPVTPSISPSTVARRTKRKRSPGLTTINVDDTPDRDESGAMDQSTPVRKQLGPRWSKSATMLEMKRLYDLTQAPRKLQYQDAYVAVFGNRFRYVPSTISHYCRWCEAITPRRLDPFVQSNSTMTVEEARTYHFQTEWRSTDHTRFQKDAKTAGEKPRTKRVKL